MQKQQFEYLKNRTGASTLIHRGMLDPEDRTLLYGYDTERINFHVYTWKGEICIYRYRGPRGDEFVSFESHFAWKVSDLHPNKRVFPERTNYHFALLLQEHGENVCYKPYPSEEELDEKYGKGYRPLWHGVIYQLTSAFEAPLIPKES